MTDMHDACSHDEIVNRALFTMNRSETKAPSVKKREHDMLKHERGKEAAEIVGMCGGTNAFEEALFSLREEKNGPVIKRKPTCARQSKCRTREAKPLF
jgi:hypothetical protein